MVNFQADAADAMPPSTADARDVGSFRAARRLLGQLSPLGRSRDMLNQRVGVPANSAAIAASSRNLRSILASRSRSAASAARCLRCFSRLKSSACPSAHLQMRSSGSV